MSRTRLLALAVHIIDADVSMMSILDIEQIAALLDMVGTTKEHINLLESDLLGLGDDEPDEEDQEDVGSHEKEERFPKPMSAHWVGLVISTGMRFTVRNLRKMWGRTG
jgi:hypothetical protein